MMALEEVAGRGDGMRGRSGMKCLSPNVWKGVVQLLWVKVLFSGIAER
jgi:hypothetical protein